MQSLRNNTKGGAITFSVVLILIIILIGFGFFILSMYFGGAQETKDAVNAGGLNVAKKALDVTVDLSGDPSQQFYNDVSDNGKINLRNINRVWAKALMVGINADGAQQDGGHAGSGSSDADSARSGAKAISDALAQKLSTPSNLYGFFDEYAKANSVRMIGHNAQVQTLQGSDWETSFLERGFESNIESVNNLPVGYSDPGLFTSTKRNPAPVDANGRQFLIGYSPLKVNNQDYWQVAYPIEQKPHITDRKYFMDNKKTPLSVGGGTWDSPVPNTFGVAGATKQSNNYNESAVSWAETNPQKIFPMQFPHGFVRVIIRKNTVQWSINGIPATTNDYGFSPDTVDSIPFPIGCGSARGTAYVGYEYIPPTLYKAICAIPPINGNAMKYILQRCQEMVPKYSMAALIGKMNLCFLDTSATDQTFYIYPNSDNSDINVMSDSTTLLPSGCDKSSSPDGSQQTLDSEPPLPAPNFATEEFDCYGSYTFPTVALVHGDRKWTPGTGYSGGCLGELEIKRTTDVYLGGVCPCP